MLVELIRVIEILLTVAMWIIIAQAILSWLLAFNVISARNDTVAGIWETLRRLTDPFYAPIRRIMPDFGALDLTPMVAIVILMILSGPGLDLIQRLVTQV
jgi:YggT family protein